ncbi:MAG: ABC transporter ATP-binding protein [Granulosicoccus sp.]|nr:ABC transporter ATP-binding protein [Granulosicoccus sp.]
MSKLELRDVVKRYKKETVIDQVSLSVAEGETLVLFGASGAGKTVLLRMIAGVVMPDQGSVFIDGHDMIDVEAEDRGVGMAFQNFALFPHMNAFDNIASPLTANKNSRDVIKSGVEKVAKLLKIDHVLTHTPRELSNGQKQRTALARALAGSPPILLLDDPLRNVDAKLRFEMRLELPQLLEQQGATVIYVTQDYKEAMALGSRIAVLAAGKIEQIGTPADIYLNPATLEIARLFGDPVINLFDVIGQRDSAGVFIELSGQRLPLTDNKAACVDTEAVLGIRPESISFVDEGTPGAIRINIEAETPLNEKIVTLALTEGGREMLISRPAGSSAPSSGSACVTINQKALLLFNRATGHRIDDSRPAVSTDEVAA